MISFHSIYKLIPIPVFWTNSLLKEWQGGASFGIFCIIRPKYKEDCGLLEHELMHCKQFYRTLGLHGLLYLLSEKYRLNAEVEAYRRQLEFYPDKAASVAWMSTAIATKYNLIISIEHIKSLLL